MFNQRATRWAFADLRRQIQRRLKNISGQFLIAMTLLAVSRNAQGQCVGQWEEELSTIPGLDGKVNAMTVFNDGSGDALYVGGYFTIAGDTVAANIAKWDGSRWSVLGSGMNGSVYALTVFDDGRGPALYAGGDFTTAGGVSAKNIAIWDGTAWSALGAGMNGSVNALAVFDDGDGPALYAAGDFDTAGDVSANNIAKWDGANWSALGSGLSSVNAYVNALTVFHDGSEPGLYAGGKFSTAGGVSANNIAKWDGASWSTLGAGLNRDVYALTVFDNGGGPALYAGGKFSTAGGVSANNVAKWDGSNWSSLGSGMNGVRMYALGVFDDGGGPALYAGGNFTAAGGVSANGIAKWDGSNWSPLGSGVCCNSYGTVTLTVFDDGGGPALYAGGDFSTAGGIVANRIAKWDGATWSALTRSAQGLGMNSPVASLTVFDDGGGPALYVGGNFSAAGGVSANSIAKWDGSSWSALGSGIGGVYYEGVGALTVFDDGGGPALYAGGHFSTAGDMSAGGIAKWDGSSWSALGSERFGIYPYVYDLTVFDDGVGPALYVALGLTVPGLPEVRQFYLVNKWDGSSWSTLSSDIDVDVFALTVFDDGGGPALYAGGDFTTAEGVNASRIAKWDGTSWSALGSGIGGGSVHALTVFDDGAGPALYAGGRFSTAGGVSANNIAKWNGTKWSPLGSGMNDIQNPSIPVATLRVFDDGGGPALYAGGNFQSAGGVSASNIAKWDGTSWTALGSGMNADVQALTVFDDGGGPALYAGGEFSTAGGNVSAYFARWSTHTETDIAGFAAGMTGPTASPGCKTYDFDCDGDVDLHDYPRFLHHFERD